MSNSHSSGLNHFSSPSNPSSSSSSSSSSSASLEWTRQSVVRSAAGVPFVWEERPGVKLKPDKDGGRTTFGFILGQEESESGPPPAWPPLRPPPPGPSSTTHLRRRRRSMPNEQRRTRQTKAMASRGRKREEVGGGEEEDHDEDEDEEEDPFLLALIACVRVDENVPRKDKSITTTSLQRGLHGFFCKASAKGFRKGMVSMHDVEEESDDDEEEEEEEGEEEEDEATTAPWKERRERRKDRHREASRNPRLLEILSCAAVGDGAGVHPSSKSNYYSYGEWKLNQSGQHHGHGHGQHLSRSRGGSQRDHVTGRHGDHPASHNLSRNSGQGHSRHLSSHHHSKGGGGGIAHGHGLGLGHHLSRNSGHDRLDHVHHPRNNKLDITLSEIWSCKAIQSIHCIPSSSHRR